MKDLLIEIEGLLPKPVVISLKDRLLISEDLDTEIDQAAYWFGYYAVLSEKAVARLNRMKFAFETWQAEVEARTAMARASEAAKPFTVAQMGAVVKSQPKFSAYKRKITKFIEDADILRAIAKAFEVRCEMIRTKAANRRREAT